MVLRNVTVAPGTAAAPASATAATVRSAAAVRALFGERFAPVRRGAQPHHQREDGHVHVRLHDAGRRPRGHLRGGGESKSFWHTEL